jgi:antitoxin component YwqK of YwqJK toxin-antitoxin module
MLRNDGKVSYTGWYNDGRPDGEFLYYDRDGQVYRKAYFENGVFVRSTRRGNNGGHAPQPYEVPLPEER